MSRDKSNPYARLYLALVDDPKFATVFDDDHLFATWVRLLMLAEGSWPASPPIPASADTEAVDALQAAGLVDRTTGGRYRIHGLDAERARRSAVGRPGWEASARVRAERSLSDRSADAPAIAEQDETSKDETRRDEPTRAHDDGLPNVNGAIAAAWEQATGLSIIGSGRFAAEYVDDAARRFPEAKVSAAILEARRSFDHVPQAAALAAALRGVLDPLPTGRETAQHRARESSARGVAATKRRLHEDGWHADERDAACPMCQAVTA